MDALVDIIAEWKTRLMVKCSNNKSPHRIELWSCKKINTKLNFYKGMSVQTKDLRVSDAIQGKKSFISLYSQSQVIEVHS